MGNRALSDEPLIHALLDLTFGLAHRSHALIADVLAELDLTHALADALWKLDPQSAAPSMRDLAARLRCDPSTVTFLADRLEERKLVVRKVDPGNRRVKIVRVTAKGRRTRRKLVEAMAIRSPIARLTASEQRRLLALLTKAIDRDDARGVGSGMR